VVLDDVERVVQVPAVVSLRLRVVRVHNLLVDLF